MIKYAILKDNIVQQVQNEKPEEMDGVIKTTEAVVCGQIYNAEAEEEKFSNPEIILDQTVIKEIERKEKGEAIDKVATITDQLNLIAGILMEQILSKPEGERTDLEKQGLQVAAAIQGIRA